MKTIFITGASKPEFIAETVYVAATDSQDQLRYVTGADAHKMDQKELTEGSEASG